MDTRDKLHVPTVLAYVTQLVLSVQLNFLANFKWTWSDRNAPFWRICWRYILDHFWTFASVRRERANRVHEERGLQLEYH